MSATATWHLSPTHGGQAEAELAALQRMLDETRPIEAAA